MPAKLTIVSEDYSNLHQSWTFTGLYRAGAGTAVLRVDIRKNAYRNQSHAKLDVYGLGGFKQFTSLPVEQWYELLPSYVQPELSYEDCAQFRWLANELLERYVSAVWGTQDGIAYKPADRPGEYDGAVADGILPSHERS